MTHHSLRRPLLARLLLGAALIAASLPAKAQETDEEEYKAQIPEVAIYKAMLDANRQPGWVQFRDFAGKQLVYFTALQTMRCRLSEIRYSVNSEALDRRFPLGTCDPQQPFNMPADDTDGRYIYLEFGPGKVDPAKAGRRIGKTGLQARHQRNTRKSQHAHAVGKVRLGGIDAYHRIIRCSCRRRQHVSILALMKANEYDKVTFGRKIPAITIC